MVQRLWRGRQQRVRYKRLLAAARTIQAFWRTRVKPFHRLR